MRAIIELIKETVLAVFAIALIAVVTVLTIAGIVAAVNIGVKLGKYLS